MLNYNTSRFGSNGFKNNYQAYRGKDKEQIYLKSIPSLSNNDSELIIKYLPFGTEPIVCKKSKHLGLYHTKIETIKGEKIIFLNISDDVSYVNISVFPPSFKSSKRELDNELRIYNHKWNGK